MSLPKHERGGRLATIAGAVLVGGASQRMGRDKARVEVAGVAAATRLARLLAGICEEVLLVGGNPPADAPGRRVADSEGPACALRGLVAALGAANTERVLVVATDLVLVTPDLLLALTAWPEADAVAPRTADGVHPLCALYRRATALAAASARLEKGELKLQGLLDYLDSSYLEPDDVRAIDPDGTALSNVNTPEDLAAAESLLRAREA